jgi:S-formylglutathione hydrolase FrmB
LHKHVSAEEFIKLFDNGEGDSFYTDWEDESEWEEEEAA